MTTPTSDIDGCAHAHQRLRDVVAGLSNEDIVQPSNLPGWTVGHVLTHLARNAEAMCRRVEAAINGQLVEQYIGGQAGRVAEINSGSARSLHEIELDVLQWSDQLDGLFRSTSEDTWGRPVRTVAGADHPVRLLPFRRWREVEVHLVDFDAGLSSREWPQELVDRTLPRLIAGLVERSDQRDLMAWLLGRGTAPDLDSWG